MVQRLNQRGAALGVVCSFFSLCVSFSRLCSEVSVSPARRTCIHQGEGRFLPGI